MKIWVNICPPSFLIVRPMRKLNRPVPSAVPSIRTFSALNRQKMMKHLMPPYYPDMSDINFLWLHESPGDGSLLGQNKWKEFSFIRTSFLSDCSSRLHSLSRTRRNFVFKLQETVSVLHLHPLKFKTVSIFFITFEFLIELSVSFLDSDSWSLISEIYDDCSSCSWLFSVEWLLFDPFRSSLSMFLV